MKISVGLENRDTLEIEVDSKGQVIEAKASGCLDLLTKMQTIKSLLPSPANQLFVFHDHLHSSLLINEALLKALNQWTYPYQEEELCHCRAIPLAKVDAAIVAGFHTVEEIAEQTSAGTACGTCRGDSQKCIEWRLKDPRKI